MISAAPQTVQNDFYRELKAVSDEDKFQSIRRYYDFFEKNNASLDDLLSYNNMDPRVDNARYFYFPTESEARRMNCFEKSATIYFALQELYPESNPALVYLFHDCGSIHVTTLFTHKGELHAGDPNYHIFGKVQLMPNALVVPSDGEEKEKIHEFKDLVQIEDSVLNNMALRLRSDSGILNFIYKSGQIAADGGYLISPGQILFMYITEERDVVSEIRIANRCIRFSNNPLTKRSSLELLACKGHWWRSLNDEERLPIPVENPYDVDLATRTKNHYPFNGIAHYIKHIMHRPFSFEEVKSFAEHPNVQRRFGEVIELAKKTDAVTYFNFLNFLKYKFESPEQLVPLSDFQDITLTKTEGGEEFNIKMPTFHARFEESELKGVIDLLRFASDAKRYTQETSKQLLANK